MLSYDLPTFFLSYYRKSFHILCTFSLNFLRSQTSSWFPANNSQQPWGMRLSSFLGAALAALQCPSSPLLNLPRSHELKSKLGKTWLFHLSLKNKLGSLWMCVWHHTEKWYNLVCVCVCFLMCSRHLRNICWQNNESLNSSLDSKGTEFRIWPISSCSRQYGFDFFFSFMDR